MLNISCEDVELELKLRKKHVLVVHKNSDNREKLKIPDSSACVAEGKKVISGKITTWQCAWILTKKNNMWRTENMRQNTVVWWNKQWYKALCLAEPRLISSSIKHPPCCEVRWQPHEVKTCQEKWTHWTEKGHDLQNRSIFTADKGIIFEWDNGAHIKLNQQHSSFRMRKLCRVKAKPDSHRKSVNYFQTAYKRFLVPHTGKETRQKPLDFINSTQQPICCYVVLVFSVMFLKMEINA